MLAISPDTDHPSTTPEAEALATYLQQRGGEATVLLDVVAADLGINREALGRARATLINAGRLTEARRDETGPMRGYTFTLLQGSLL